MRIYCREVKNACASVSESIASHLHFRWLQKTVSLLLVWWDSVAFTDNQMHRSLGRLNRQIERWWVEPQDHFNRASPWQKSKKHFLQWKIPSWQPSSFDQMVPHPDPSQNYNVTLCLTKQKFILKHAKNNINYSTSSKSSFYKDHIIKIAGGKNGNIKMKWIHLIYFPALTVCARCVFKMRITATHYIIEICHS